MMLFPSTERESRQERRKGLGTQARLRLVEDDVDELAAHMEAIRHLLVWLLTTCIGILVSLVSTLAVELIRIH